MRASFKKQMFLLGVALFLFSCARTHTPEEIDELFEPITSRYGIEIVYKIDENFAPILIGGNHAQFSKAKPIDGYALAKCPHVLEKALAIYPVKVVKEHLNAIYFAKEIDQNGFKVAGTYDQFRRIIYLVNDGRQPDHFYISTFHHEFSSLLLNRYGFLLNPWSEQNPKGFKYRREIYDDWKKEYEGGAAREIIPAYEDGFIRLYGQTNFENDFNEYAAMIFTHPQKFKKIMGKYPRVRGKFLLFLDFYRKIDPVFTEAYLLGEKQ